MASALAPALVRLVLDTAERDDDDAWALACGWVDEAQLDEAREGAWDAAMFVAALLVRLRRDQLIDPDTEVAEWGLRLAQGVGT